MYKVVWIARFTPDKSREEADTYWAESHGPSMAKVKPLAGYVQSHVVGPVAAISGADEATHFDGYSCAWWNSREDFEQAMTTPEWQYVVDDGDNVFDMSWLWNMSAEIEEVTQIEGPKSPYKAVWVVRFKEGMSRAEGREYWTNTHGPIFKELDIDRYVQNQVVGPVGAEGESDAEIGFDGFSECWFKNEQQLIDAIESDAWAAAVEDGLNVFDMNNLWGAVLEENVVVAPPEPARR
jgi:uncharacterized protein (TIGR02118 family)